jgi:hypothetical protein
LSKPPVFRWKQANCRRGSAVDADEDAFYDLVIGVAERRVSKAAVTVFLEKHARHAP